VLRSTAVNQLHIILSAGIVTLFALVVWHAIDGDAGPISDADADDSPDEDDDGIERIDI